MIQRLLMRALVGSCVVILTLIGFTGPVGAATPTPQPTLPAPAGLISPTVTVTPTATVTATGNTGEQPQIRRTTVVTTQQLPALRATPTPEAAEPLTGTIVSNRGDFTARFFVEGRTIEVAASRAISFELPRGTTVLNLYNCAASTPESNDDCYWDPYILQRDGFYEIYQSRSAGVNTVARLMLRAADTPPTDQIWVQNRSANIESIVHNNEVIELAPAAIQEFSVDPGLPAILYVRSCIVLDAQSACEWTPKTLETGIYYALAEVETPGGLPGSRIVNIDLQPVVGELGDTIAASNDTPAGTSPDNDAGSDEVVCRVQVPVLNVRSGPGLQYQIIDKIFSSQDDPGDVRMVGRNSDNQWLVVDPAVAADGWVTANENFVVCENDFTQLPVVQAPAPPPEPAPAQVVVPGTPAEEPTGEEDSEPVAEETTGEGEEDTGEEGEAVSEIGLPEGYAMLVVHNGFQHSIRFTIDQSYRLEVGPSEIDLEPGQAQNIVVFPGPITFSVSTPWRGLSDNALIQVEPDTTETLWLRFESDGSDTSWRLNW